MEGLLSDCERRNVVLYVSEVGNRLMGQFGGERVYRTLGFRNLRALLESLEGVRVDTAGLVVTRAK